MTQSTFLYIVRHGESMNNTTKIILPPDEDILTDHGKLQASLLGSHLSDVKFTKVYTSDYIRCVDTTKILLSKSNYAEVTQLKVELDQRLRERNVGTFEGGPYHAIIKYMAENVLDRCIPATEVEFEGGETSEDMKKKVESFLTTILETDDKSNKGSSILTTSHGYFILFLAHYLHGTPKFILKNASDVLLKLSPNTGWIKLEFKKPISSESPWEVLVHAEYDTTHLKPLNTDDALTTYTKTNKIANRFNGCIHQ